MFGVPRGRSQAWQRRSPGLGPNVIARVLPDLDSTAQDLGPHQDSNSIQARLRGLNKITFIARSLEKEERTRQMQGAVTSVLEKYMDISEVTFPRRGAGARSWRVEGNCGRAPTGLCFLLLAWPPFEARAAAQRRAGLGSEAEAVFEAAERKPVVGGQDFLTLVLGSGLSPQAHQEACCPHQGALSLEPDCPSYSQGRNSGATGTPHQFSEVLRVSETKHQLKTEQGGERLGPAGPVGMEPWAVLPEEGER